MTTHEVNFDGLVGPTHHYGGLSLGNLASFEHAFTSSNPKQAALQGLQKMRFLMDLHIPQAVLPPPERPYFPILRRLGFTGTDHQILSQLYKNKETQKNPRLLLSLFSASSMWAANAATVAPSADTHDGRVHITPANLITHFHRAIEVETTYPLLKRIFYNETYFKVHPPLPPQLAFSDEGAANHNRFCKSYGDPGFQLFVYGKTFFESSQNGPLQFPARQTKEASVAIARLHELNSKNTFFVQQNPLVIDQGVFHNDVIALANETVFLYHEEAFVETEALIQTLQKNLPFKMHFLPVRTSELSVADAVRSYLFNSQLVTRKDGTMELLAPIESQETPAAHRVLNRLLEENTPIKQVRFVDCRQSMNNGGGPACLRLRVVLKDKELKACHPGVILTNRMHESLVAWVSKYYRDRLTPSDLFDPNFLDETRQALDALSQLLDLNGFYEFQRDKHPRTPISGTY